MRLLVAVTAVVVLSGCTTWDVDHRWTKPGVASQQLALDDIECRRQQYDSGWTPDLIVGGMVDAARAEIEALQRDHTYDNCMAKRGYARARGTKES
jgi:hypothetical protein